MWLHCGACREQRPDVIGGHELLCMYCPAYTVEAGGMAHQLPISLLLGGAYYPPARGQWPFNPLLEPWLPGGGRDTAEAA